MTKLWLIQVKKLDNPLLHEVGWRAGRWVRAVVNDMSFEHTFETCQLGETTPYDSLEGAQWAISEKSKHFVGVEFEAVEFRSTR